MSQRSLIALPGIVTAAQPGVGCFLSLSSSKNVFSRSQNPAFLKEAVNGGLNVELYAGFSWIIFVVRDCFTGAWDEKSRSDNVLI